MGPMGGPMDFGRSKSKFQEIPETGVMFDQVNWACAEASCDFILVGRSGCVLVRLASAPSSRRSPRRASCLTRWAELSFWIFFSQPFCSGGAGSQVQVPGDPRDGRHV